MQRTTFYGSVGIAAETIISKHYGDGWMTCDFTSFSTVSVISGRWEVDNERLCAMEFRLWLRRFCLERGSNSVR